MRAAGATAATPRSHSFLGVLAGLVRALALVNGLICLYALVQALALTARERRSPVAVMRAFGAGRGTLALVFFVMRPLLRKVMTPEQPLLLPQSAELGGMPGMMPMQSQAQQAKRALQ